MSPRLLLFTLLFIATAPAAPEYKWEKIEGCTLVPGEWQDGDSFTVRIAPRKFRIMRLYFVDTPEDGKDTRFPERIAEQAKYFGVSVDRVQELGHEAAEFTKKKLSAKPFTVYTLWQDAMGSSKKSRYYAMVEVDGRWLTGLLVQNGLARIYGKRITLPCGTSSREYLAILKASEDSAKRERLGGWSTTGSPKADPFSRIPAF